MKKETIAVTINNDEVARVLGTKKGAKIDVETRGGVPVSRWWRNRFADAEHDKAIILPTVAAKKTPKEQPTSEGDK